MKRFMLAIVSLSALATMTAATANARPSRPVTESAAQATFLLSRDSQSCANWGAYPVFQVGTNATSVRRALVKFNLPSFPHDAQIVSATLSLYETITLRGSGTVGVYRATTPWAQGTGMNTCTNDGANWTETGTGTNWGTPGGDFTAPEVAQVIKTAGQSPGWDRFDITALVQGWATGAYPNDGLLLKLNDETYSPCTTLTNCDYWSYASDHYNNPVLRPKLTISYRPRGHHHHIESHNVSQDNSASRSEDGHTARPSSS